MTVKELEQRVAALEQEVRQLRDDLTSKDQGNGQSWVAAVEKFAGDKDLQSVFAEARKLREKDRERARQRAAKPRRRRS